MNGEVPMAGSSRFPQGIKRKSTKHDLVPCIFLKLFQINHKVLSLKLNTQDDPNKSTCRISGKLATKR